MLILGQYAVAKLSLLSPRFRRMVKSEPRVLLLHGQVNEAAMRDERITLEEVESVVRSAGFSSLSAVGAVILETDGSFHVVNELEGDCSAMRHVVGVNINAL